MDLSLNADAALRAYLPPESWNGDAQHRFIFRTEDGEEEPLLARLAIIRPNKYKEKFEYCVVLRPENAENERIFVAQYWEIHGRNPWLTPTEARHFNWSLFEQTLTRNKHRCSLSRFWLMREEERDALLRFDADGFGTIEAFEDAKTGATIGSQRFMWLQDQYTSLGQRDLEFLRQTNTNFENQFYCCRDNSTGEIRVALIWQRLDNAERDARAFRCQNGEWKDLLCVAALSLLVRISRLRHSLNDKYTWELDDIDGIPVTEDVPSNDVFLGEWRVAIMQVFQPNNIDEAGAMVVERHLCIWSHINDSQLSSVQAEAPSHHELLEAQLQLREWANAHFPPEWVEHLLSL